jgi:hypothetical protein
MPLPDISLGPDRWLTLVHVPYVESETLPIDDLIAFTQPLWQRLETECVAECCSLDAFNFWPEQIAQLPLHEREDFRQRLDTVSKKLRQQPHHVLSSYTLNLIINKDIFLQLLDHLKAHL